MSSYYVSSTILDGHTHTLSGAKRKSVVASAAAAAAKDAATYAVAWWHFSQLAAAAAGVVAGDKMRKLWTKRLTPFKVIAPTTGFISCRPLKRLRGDFIRLSRHLTVALTQADLQFWSAASKQLSNETGI